MKKWIKTLSRTSGTIMALMVVLSTITGCSDDKSTSLTNPTAASLQPTGTVQGVVRDSVTLEPIVGAKVSIGVQAATTDAYGQYVLSDVPATTDALNGSINDVYRMTVDLRSVTSPVAMTTTTTTPRYPNFTYHDVELRYTSLNDSVPCPDFGPTDNQASETNTGLTNCGQNSTNHDTPVDGMVATVTTEVGKLDASITGVVAGCDGAGFEDEFFTPVGAGYTVKLYSNTAVTDKEGNSATGQSGHLIDETTTDANGAYSFNNIEANLAVSITAENSGGTMTDTVTNTTPADGETLALAVQESTALHVCPEDVHGPTIVTISPESGSDQAPGSTSVVITFSEAVKQTPTTSVDPSGEGNLFDDIEVNFDGTKAGNVAYSLTWNTAFDTLTVTFTTGSSSLYDVRIKNIDTRFTDANGVAADMGICDDDSVPAGLTGNPYGIAADAGTTDCTVYFSTNGASTPAATTSLTVTNASSQDVGSTSALLDWPVISGAKSYNLYCGQNQIYQDATSQAGGMEFVTNLTASQTTLNPTTLGGYVGAGNEHSLQYSCLIRGYNSDLKEGADSNTVTLKDAVGPDFTANGTNTSTTVTVTFTEPVRESDAETLGNYVLTGTDSALTLTSVSYDTATFVATLTYSGNITNDVGDTLTITNVKDLAGVTNLTTPTGNNQDGL